jgi:hypothetical protein
MISLSQFDQTMTPHRKIANLEGAIHLIRGQRVMLDSDLAGIYGVRTKRLNEQVRRNIARFSEDFAFQISADELLHLRSQIATSKKVVAGAAFVHGPLDSTPALCLVERVRRARRNGRPGGPSPP